MRLRNVGEFLSTHTPPTHGPSTNMQQCNAEWDNKNAFLFLAFRFGQTRNLMSCSIQSTYLPACRCGCGGHANQHAMQYAQLTIFIVCLHALASPIYIYIYISIGVWPFVAHIDRNMADIWALPRSVCRCPSPHATRHTRSFAHCIFVFFLCTTHLSPQPLASLMCCGVVVSALRTQEFKLFYLLRSFWLAITIAQQNMQ